MFLVGPGVASDAEESVALMIWPGPLLGSDLESDTVPGFRRGYLGRGRTANAPSRHRNSSGMLMLGRGHWQERPGLVGRP